MSETLTVHQQIDEAFTWRVRYDDGTQLTEEQALDLRDGAPAGIAGWRLVDLKAVRMLEAWRPGEAAPRLTLPIPRSHAAPVFTRRRRQVHVGISSEVRSRSTITIFGWHRLGRPDRGVFFFFWPDGHCESSNDFEAYQE